MTMETYKTLEILLELTEEYIKSHTIDGKYQGKHEYLVVHGRLSSLYEKSRHNVSASMYRRNGE